MLRLFVAIDIPPPIVEQIHNICYGIKDVRWVEEGQIHLTLRFIGNCDNSLFNDIRIALDKIRLPVFSLAPEGVGYFPPRGKPKVLWVGIKHSPELHKLNNAVEKSLRDTGIKEEQKKFHPHITVARLKTGAASSAIIPFLSRNNLFKTSSFSVNEFHLYSSTLSREGAVHRIEETYMLRNSSGSGFTV